MKKRARVFSNGRSGDRLKFRAAIPSRWTTRASGCSVKRGDEGHPNRRELCLTEDGLVEEWADVWMLRADAARRHSIEPPMTDKIHRPFRNEP